LKKVIRSLLIDADDRISRDYSDPGEDRVGDRISEGHSSAL
jgi:hypothetical protein